MSLINWSSTYPMLEQVHGKLFDPRLRSSKKML